MKRTPWFQPDVKPVHTGEYECLFCGNGKRHLWDGRDWRSKFSGMIFNPFHWRGLATKPKGKK